MAGSSESGNGASELDVAEELFLRRVFLSCLLPSEGMAKLNIALMESWPRWACLYMPACAMRR